MITVWNQEGKTITPLIKAPVEKTKEGLYHIPLMKVPKQGNYDVYEYEDFLGERLNAGKVPVYPEKPHFNRETLKFEISPDAAGGWIVGYDIIDEIVWVKILPNGPKKESLLMLLDSDVWLDVSVPYIARCDSGVKPNHIVEWSNLVFIKMADPQAIRELISGV